jgi:hypothetical protein
MATTGGWLATTSFDLTSTNDYLMPYPIAATATTATTSASWYQQQYSNMLNSYNSFSSGIQDYGRKDAVTQTKKRFIEELRDEIKNWHGDLKAA